MGGSRWPGRSLVLGLGLTLALVCAASAAADNLLANPGFDSNLDSWMPAGYITDSVIEWSELDAADSMDSGSVRLEIDPADQGNTIRVTQCVTAQELAEYDFGAAVYVPFQDQVPTVSLWVSWYDQRGCSGQINSYATSQGPLLDTWTQIFEENVESPAGTVSAEVFTMVYEPETGTFEAYFDDVYLVPEPLRGLASFSALCVLSVAVRRRC